MDPRHKGEEGAHEEPPPVGEAAEGRWGEVLSLLCVGRLPTTPPTDRYAIASPTGRGSWLWG